MRVEVDDMAVETREDTGAIRLSLGGVVRRHLDDDQASRLIEALTEARADLGTSP
jgi:hypothetical protein